MFKYLSKTVGCIGYVIQYGCVTHCIFEYIGDFVVCSGPSMEPTLYSNNILLTERITPRLSRIQRGDIVIAKCPTNPLQHICKRVVGLPGDKIISTEPTIHNLPIFDQQKLPVLDKENNISTEVKTVSMDDDNKQSLLIPIETLKKLRQVEIIVPRGHVWIEGDNCENSADSRFYGPIPQGLIKSRAICRLWPIRDIKSLT